MRQSKLLPTAKAQRWGPAEVLRVLLEEEAAVRDAATIRNCRRANSPERQDLRHLATRRLHDHPSTQQALRGLEWIRRIENLAVVRPPAPTSPTCWRRWATPRSTTASPWRGFTIETLGQPVTRHCADDTVANAGHRVLKTDLVVTDIGLLPVPTEAAEALSRVIDAVYERRSVSRFGGSGPRSAV